MSLSGSPSRMSIRISGVEIPFGRAASRSVGDSGEAAKISRRRAAA